MDYYTVKYRMAPLIRVIHLAESLLFIPLSAVPKGQTCQLSGLRGLLECLNRINK
jgi:hypothetical protein